MTYCSRIGEGLVNKRKLGDEYEKLAVDFLEKEGFTIIERNFRNRYGEIDIIANEDGQICFCEVKYRSNIACGQAVEAVNYHKQKKITNVAYYYLMTNGMNEWTPCRFDIIAIDGDNITLFRNAFESTI